MSIFSSPNDAPFQIRTEGQTITLTYKPGVPVTGQATLEWTLPIPAQGCTQGDGLGVYCGIVIIARTQPVDETNIPQDGKVYDSDPTVNLNTHSGDKIGDALVVGAFYEGEKRSRGEPLTTSLIVSDIDPKVGYFFAGYAVDCQLRYHADGVRAYSGEYGNKKQPDTPGYQVIKLGDNGVLPTDGTQLTPGFLYGFEAVYNEQFPVQLGEQKFPITLDGINAGTYQQLVDEINKQLARITNPPQSPIAPNTGRYYWDGSQLHQWDGNQHLAVDATVEPNDPAAPLIGDYWHDTTTHQLKRWQLPNPFGWNIIPIIEYSEDPRSLAGGDDYWFDGTTGHRWCSTTWCQQNTIVSDENPLTPPVPECGTYWFDTANSILYQWNIDQERWLQVGAVYWNVAPNNLVNGTYWFDLTNSLLNQWNAGSWTNLAVIIDDEEPNTAGGVYWFNSSTEQLFLRNIADTAWIEQDVIVWLDDPTDTQTCELWWNSNDDLLYKWDIVNSQWDLVASFIQQPTDPHGIPNIPIDTLWHDSNDNRMYKWDGLRWIEVSYVRHPTDPTLPTLGTSWYNPQTQQWNIFGTSVANNWNPVNPIDTSVDPFLIPQGTLWFNTSTNTLYERIGSSWVAIPFSSQPLTPSEGQQWLNSSTNTLYTWTKGQWVETPPLIVASLDQDGNLRFTTTKAGSNFSINVSEPTNGSEYLFPALTPTATIQSPTAGTDGISNVPSYMQLGVGDDGTPDERREVIDTVRQQLGHPVITVELTPYQLDQAVTSAIEVLRQRTTVAYKRAFFFLNVQGYQQKYILSNKVVGYNKIVDIMSIYRMTSAFLSTMQGAGVYGQIVLQHLYNMGTFDLVSYHLVAQYVETMEHLFAARLTYHWDEASRQLQIYHHFGRPERVLIDAMIERTEQEILRDRMVKQWIERYALMRARYMLAEIRGKYSTLPGAGGGVSLNASDLRAAADTEYDRLMTEIEDFIADTPENIGMHSTFIFG